MTRSSLWPDSSRRRRRGETVSAPSRAAGGRRASTSIEGEAHFADYDDVILLGPGGSDNAGFVQVMQGRVADAERERRMTRDFAQRPMDFRPDILGGIAAIGDDGDFVQAIYFTSEADAREGEQKPMPSDMQEMIERARRTRSPSISSTSPHRPSRLRPGGRLALSCRAQPG